MKLTMLGTGNAQVTECYNTCFLLEDRRQLFLIDGGGGSAILRQLKYAGADWRDVRQIFVTHKHIDHLLGIVWMMRMICQSMSRGKYEGEAAIYAHGEVLALLRELGEKLLAEKDAKHLGGRLRLVEVHDGETLPVIGHDVTFFDIRSTKAKQFGFSMELGDGRRLTCCGDEPYEPSEEPYAKNSDWLLHEAFCLYGQRDVFRPYEKHHSTVKDACLLAESLGVKNLLLYHTEDKNIRERKALYTAEGARYFHGNLFVPDDLETFEL